MPQYEFVCQNCGPFVQWMSMSSVKESIPCVTCDNPANRMYTPPGVILTPYALRRRVEQSAVPKVVRREQDAHHHGHSHNHSSHRQGGHHHTANRPWMAGH